MYQIQQVNGAQALAQASIERLLLTLTAFNPRAPSTLLQYPRVAQRFLAGAGSVPPTRDDVLRCVARCKAQATKRFTFTILKKLFEANQWPWDFPRSAAPQVREYEQHQARLDEATMLRLVTTARRQGGASAFYMAMATTYGLRRAELAMLSKRDFADGHVSIQTVHGSFPRHHRVPDEIQPYISPPRQGRNPATMSRVFGDLVRQARATVPPRSGWHAVRRSLVSELVMTCPSVAIVRFIGWRAGPEARMLYRYARPPEEDVDTVVFEHHPYLEYWR